MDDAALRAAVEAARGHDPDAWEALYRHAYPRLFAYARRRVGSDERADDAVSEAMVRAMDAIGRFRWTPSGFDGWLFGIMRNTVLETYREDRRAGVPLDAHALDRPDEHAPRPGDAQLAAEERDLVRRAMVRMPPAERELLELRVVAGLDSKGVAEVVGRRAGAVRMAQGRALERLRGLLSEEGGL